MILFWTREGSEVNPPDQGSLQRDGELLECVHDAGERVHGAVVSQQGTLLKGMRRQGALCQEGKPLSHQPVPGCGTSQ